MLLYITAEDVFGDAPPGPRPPHPGPGFTGDAFGALRHGNAPPPKARAAPLAGRRRAPGRAGLEARPPRDPNRPLLSGEAGTRARDAGRRLREGGLALAGRGVRGPGLRGHVGGDRARRPRRRARGRAAGCRRARRLLDRCARARRGSSSCARTACHVRWWWPRRRRSAGRGVAPRRDPGARRNPRHPRARSGLPDDRPRQLARGRGALACGGPRDGAGDPRPGHGACRRAPRLPAARGRRRRLPPAAAHDARRAPRGRRVRGRRTDRDPLREHGERRLAFLRPHGIKASADWLEACVPGLRAEVAGGPRPPPGPKAVASRLRRPPALDRNRRRGWTKARRRRSRRPA